MLVGAVAVHGKINRVILLFYGILSTTGINPAFCSISIKCSRMNIQINHIPVARLRRKTEVFI
jgi:hypothetical protein